MSQGSSFIPACNLELLQVGVKHRDMLKVAWAPNYVLPLPPNHRFPMSKYEVLPQQLLHEGTINESNIFQPGPDSVKLEQSNPEFKLSGSLSQFDSGIVDLILKTHSAAYFDKLVNLSLTPKEIRRTGFPLTPQLVDREIAIMNGTVQCTLYAFEFGVSMNIAGGTHHAFTSRGEGFCLLNDIAIAANFLLYEKLAEKILVVDLDVHQGNGTAEIFRNDPRVFTFSMHGANNYPLMKETSDLDIGLSDYTDDAFYLKTLDSNLKNLLDQLEPDFIFFQSGVDILDTDKLGRLSVTREGCKQRDRLMLTLARKNKIPLVASMGGGYSPDFRDIIEAHANTYRLAQEIFF